MNLLAKAASFSAAILASDLPRNERLDLLEPFFSPEFSKPLTLDPHELRNIKFRKDPLNARGFILVSPPKGSCFIVKRRQDMPDAFVCKPANLSFSLGDIDYAGKITWEVITGKGDFGTKVTWKTPYRLAQFAESKNKKGVKKGHATMILSCEAREKPFRQIKLKTLMGVEWLIRFPKFDELLPQPEEENLFFTVKKEKSGLKISTDKPEQPQKPNPPQTPKTTAPKKAQDGDKDLAKNLSGLFSNMKEKSSYLWRLTPKNTYEMSSDFFTISGRSKGGTGKCRYRFKGAPHDEEKGLIECWKPQNYYSILMPIVCGQDLERPNPLNKTTLNAR